MAIERIEVSTLSDGRISLDLIGTGLFPDTPYEAALILDNDESAKIILNGSGTAIELDAETSANYVDAVHATITLTIANCPTNTIDLK